MINIREIDHVVLRCEDIDRMLAFYRDVLCCPVDGEAGGQVWSLNDPLPSFWAPARC